jgi:hypothetical protein
VFDQLACLADRLRPIEHLLVPTDAQFGLNESAVAVQDRSLPCLSH